MSDQIRALLLPNDLRAALFPPTSRYYGVEIAKVEQPDGTTLVYLRRRFVPSPERFALIREHVVRQGDRLDNVTAQYLGDPEQFWQIADANNAMNPADLTDEPNRRLRITLPEGIPGS